MSGSKAKNLALAAGNIDNTGNIMADMLDNIDSLSFIRSDIDDTVTGDITFSDIVVNDTAAFGKYIKIGSYANDSARDSAIPSPQYGMVIYNATAGVLQQYIGDNVWASIAPSASITGVVLPGSQTAVTQGDSITVNGIGFDSGATIEFLLNGAVTNATTTTRISATQLIATIPALSEGVYDVRVTNGTGVQSTLSSAITVDGLAVFNSAAGSLGTVIDNTTISALDAGATEDGTAATIVITSGALPNGLSMSSTGSITGTVSVNVFASTAYNFTVSATDAENQTSSRAFSITVEPNYTMDGSIAFNGPKE